MGLQVVDLDEGFPQGGGEAFGETNAYEQRPQQTGPAGEGDGVDFGLVDAGLPQGSVDHGYDVLLVGARSKFGHHAAVLFVYFLAGDDIGEHSLVAEHCRRGVVAARFDS